MKKMLLNFKKNEKNIKIGIYIIIYIVASFFVYLPLKINVMYIIAKHDFDNANSDGIYYSNFYSFYTNNTETENKKRTLFYAPISYNNSMFHIKKNNYKFYYSNGFMCISKDYNDKKINYRLGKCKNESIVLDSKEESQKIVIPKDGKYRIELWGANGGNSYALAHYYDKSRNGAYVSGEINLFKGQVLYAYVGSKGDDSQIIKDYNRMTIFYYPSIGGTGGYNGGGDGADDPQTDAGGGGGGATDIRLIGGKWNDFDSLKSRIMVAGGAGGNSRYWNMPDQYNDGIGQGGAGGTLNGLNATSIFDFENPYGLGATQTDGYKFGQGQTGIYCKSSSNGLGGGAGGYFGSLSGACPKEMFAPPTGAGGGSSYVSGCKKCRSITINSAEDDMKFSGNVHYSKLKFSNIIMKNGMEKRYNYYDKNKDDGIVKITILN